MRCGWLTSRAIAAQVSLLRCLAPRAKTASGSLSPPLFGSDGPTSILVVRLDEIGDAVLTVPMIRALRRNWPDAHISLAVSPVVRALFSGCPYVDEVLVCDQSGPRWLRPIALPARALKMARTRLVPRGYDLAISPRWDTDGYYASLLAFYSGARCRLGYSETVTARRRALNRGFDSLLTHAVCSTHEAHEVERNLDLVRYLGGEAGDTHLELWPSDSDRRRVTDLLRPLGRVPGPLIALCLGARAPQRRWPAQRYVEIAVWLQDRARAGIIVVGGPGDHVAGEALAQALVGPALCLAGRCTLPETAAVLAHCDVYVGNDTGPMHIAAAVGTPIVAISSFAVGGPGWHWNSPTRFGPWDVLNRVVQPDEPRRPCQLGCGARSAHCILDVTVPRVQTAVGDILEARDGGGHQWTP